MMPAMYAAISGLEAHQTMLDVTANNLANVDTIGYKGQRTTFADELSQTLNPGSGVVGGNSGSNPEQVGLGVKIGSIDNLMGAGSLQTTGNPLDIAIQGDGFLRVGAGIPGPGVAAIQQAGGVAGTGNEQTYPIVAGSANAVNTIQYTRAGNLTINPKGFLCTQSGQYVVGQAALAIPTAVAPATTPATYTYTYSSTTAGGVANTATYINVPPGSTNVAIGQDGSVTYTDQTAGSSTNGQQVTAGYLTLATFPNEAGLTRDGGSLWSTSQNSGTATIGTPNTGGYGQTIAGSLEMSNVDMATEFTNMIEAERGYQANSKVITTADQMLQTVVQMAQ
jgi:flagellar hook protein FlgE